MRDGSRILGFLRGGTPEGSTWAIYRLDSQRKELLEEANALDGQAKGFYNTASQVRLTIPEWQNAGIKAASRIAWECPPLFCC